MAVVIFLKDLRDSFFVEGKYRYRRIVAPVHLADPFERPPLGPADSVADGAPMGGDGDRRRPDGGRQCR